MSRPQLGKDQFVSNGAERDRLTPEYAAEVVRIEAQVRAEFQDSLRGAGWFRRSVLEFQVKREISRRVERLSPSSALYAVSGK